MNFSGLGKNRINTNLITCIWTFVTITISGAGTFVFNLITRYLIDTYTWRGTVLILGGILLHGVPCGLLLLPARENTTNGKTPEATQLTQYVDSADKQCEYTVVSTVDDLEKHYMTEVRPKYEQKGDFNADANQATKRSRALDGCDAIFNFELLRDVRCLLFLLSAFMVQLAFTIPFNLLPDMAVESGMSKYQASWLISTIGNISACKTYL